MSKFLPILIIIAILCCISCSVVADMYGLDVSGYKPDTTNLDPNYLPSTDEIQAEVNRKYMINSEAFKKEWVIDRINYWIRYYDFDDINYHKLPELYKNLVFDKVYFDIDELRGEALEEFPEEEYFKPKSDISLVLTLKKGDIILTRSNYYMNILLGSRYSFHHAMLVVDEPTSDVDNCIITSYPEGYTEKLSNVCLVSIDDLKYEEFIVVLRFYNLEQEKIDSIVDYAMSQLGKPYNNDYIIKSKSDSFYCSQLIYKSYLSVGLDIDSNNNNWDDHGIVHPNDIYKSPYLRVIKYGN